LILLSELLSALTGNKRTDHIPKSASAGTPAYPGISAHGDI